MKNATFSFELDIVKAKKIDEEKGDQIIVGYASTCDVDSDGMQITRKALEGAKDDLLKYNTVLFNHNMDKPVGRVLETAVDDKGLLVKIAISKVEEELWNKIVDKTISKFSIAGRILEYQETSPDNEGKTIVQITKISLHEVSVVSVPANVEAASISAYVSKSLQKSNEEKKESIPEIKKGLIQQLEILAGKLEEGDNKTLLEEIINVLKGRKKEDKKEEKMIKELKFDDTSESRPVFQLNSTGTIDLDESNKFRKQILKYGKWFHWNADGGVLNVTKDIIKKMVDNFNKKYVENVSVPLTHTNDPSKNTGSVVSLEQTEKGLDAVIEIKDETVAEKIKKGLIKSISASIDPNYLKKDKNEFVGPVLLHTALVGEPYIKGMAGFVELADEDYKDRQIIELEDSEENPAEIIKSAANALLKAAELLDKKDEKETEVEEKKEEKETVEEKTTKDEELPEETPEAEKADEVESEEKETKKEKDENLDLSDAEGTYAKYLSEGKIVPAQKSAFIELMQLSKKAIELGDDKVDVKKFVFDFLDKSPKIVNFDEDGVTPDPSNPAPEEEKKEEMPQEAKDFYINKMELSEEDAEKAWMSAKELSDKEKSENQESIF
jgi:HK97 family phage prohead protease